MSHPSIERLAALADEQPTTDEKAHLDRCARCAQEVDAHRSLLAMAGSERETMSVPLTRWDSLSKRLRAEGLVVGPGMWDAMSGHEVGPHSVFRIPLPASRFLLQIAAGLLLIAGGAMAGRWSAGAPVVPGGVTGTEAPQSAIRPFSANQIPTTFASVEEAQQWKALYTAAYQNAVSFLAANDSGFHSPETPAVMRARLSALDRVSRTMREALNDAPYDPVINDFYLNSFGQREATLRQLNAVLPQGVRMNGF